MRSLYLMRNRLRYSDRKFATASGPLLRIILRQPERSAWPLNLILYNPIVTKTVQRGFQPPSFVPMIERTTLRLSLDDPNLMCRWDGWVRRACL